jgi:hypothetical protein
MTRITKSQRVLLIVNELVTNAEKFKNLYAFIESSGVAVPKKLLGSQYRSISVLRGSSVTPEGVARRLGQLARTPGVKAVDLFFQLHGVLKRVKYLGDGDADVTCSVEPRRTDHRGGRPYAKKVAMDGDRIVGLRTLMRWRSWCQCILVRSIENRGMLEIVMGSARPEFRFPLREPVGRLCRPHG